MVIGKSETCILIFFLHYYWFTREIPNMSLALILSFLGGSMFIKLQENIRFELAARYSVFP